MGALVIAAVVILGFLAVLWFVARRDLTLCLLSVRAGEVTVARGAVLPRIVSDLREIVRRPLVSAATVRVLRGKTFARVETSGALTPAQEQQIRNIVGSVPLAKLLSKQKRG